MNFGWFHQGFHSATNLFSDLISTKMEPTNIKDDFSIGADSMTNQGSVLTVAHIKDNVYEIPRAIEADMEENKKLFNRFYRTFEENRKSSSGDISIPPLLEHWIFFAVFIANIPAHRHIDTESVLKYPYLENCIPKSLVGKKSEKLTKEFSDNIRFFSDICFGSEVNFKLEESAETGRLGIFFKTTDQGILNSISEQMVGIAFYVEKDVAVAFGRQEKMQRIFSLISFDGKKHFIVIGPIVYANHGCSSDIQPQLTKKAKEIKFVSSLKPTFNLSAQGVFLTGIPKQAIHIENDEFRVCKSFCMMAQPTCDCNKCHKSKSIKGKDRPSQL